MKYRIFFFLSLLLMPLSAGGLFLAFLSLPTTSLLFCITELFSATASLSAILFFGIGFFQMVKEQNNYPTCRKILPTTKNPSIIIWKQYKKQSAPSNIQKHFLLWSHSYFVLPEVILLPIVQILT